MADEKITEKSSETKTPSPRLTTLQLGVYEVSMLAETAADVKKHTKDLFAAAPLIRRLASEIYQIDPFLFVIFSLSKVWGGIESAVLMYLSMHILTIVSQFLCTSAFLVLNFDDSSKKG
jgi:hypothetical protein